MAKTGRNSPCFCGSGKKYKHCCYGKDAEPLKLWGDDSDWLKIRRTEGEIVYEILNYAATNYPGVLEEASHEFTFWGEYELNDEHIEAIFCPWVAFNWVPEPTKGESPISYPDDILALEYLEKNSDKLDVYKKAFIYTACSQPFSFFAVKDTVQGKSIELYDIFLNRNFTVKEAQASKTLRRGDIVFTKVLLLDGQAIMVGMAPIAIPPSEHIKLLSVRDGLKKEMSDDGFTFNVESLLEWDAEMREIYLELAEYLMHPPRLQLRNTDGEEIKFVKLYFDLQCSPQMAFDALQPLAVDQKAILGQAIRDEKGELLEVTFSWLRKGNKKHKSWDNTILGQLTIKGASLTAEVNSKNRADKIKSEIKNRLGKNAVFKRALHESIDAILDEIEAQTKDQSTKPESAEQKELPEALRDVIRRHLKKHWEGWYHEPIPALRNKTPLQAARTAAGRELLEALLIDYERRNEEIIDPLLRVDVDEIRKRLMSPTT
jgi:hypothetical protein